MMPPRRTARHGMGGGAPAAPRLPLLDRILDPDSEEIAESGSETLFTARLRDAIIRDVELLLNARRSFHRVPGALREVQTSPVTFGIPDCTTFRSSHASEREAIRQEIEQALRQFEPRLASVTVTLQDPNQRFGKVLRIRIDAILAHSPTGEAISVEASAPDFSLMPCDNHV